MSMVNKPSRMVTYNEELPSIKSHDPLITWDCDFNFSYVCVYNANA